MLLPLATRFRLPHVRPPSTLAQVYQAESTKAGSANCAVAQSFELVRALAIAAEKVTNSHQFLVSC